MGLIAIGDIHGCARTLERLLEKIDPSLDDHLVFVGDYVDRGPDSKSVVEQLLNLQETHRCTFLRGNHEALMRTYLDGQDYSLWRVNGGDTTLDSYSNESRTIDIPETHETFLRSAELYYETPDFFFVHGGLKPHLTIRENLDRFDEDVLLWERSHLDARDVAWEKTVVCGHTPRKEPIDRDHLIALDTGCVYYTHPGLGRLTAVYLPERTFVSVEYAG